MRQLSRLLIVLLSLACALPSVAQTFEVGPQNAPANPQQKKKSSKSEKSPTAEEPPSIGWGAGLEVAREARAAQDALRNQHYVDASNHAERAAKAAPQNAELWFLYGYTSRLAGHFDDSLYAFKRGLKVRPNSVQGLSGMAQTYVKMGQRDKALEILQEVLAANPSSPNDLQLAGELFLTTDPGHALELLTRSEQLVSDARTELLMARAYTLLKKPEDARRYLERARSRAPHDSNVLRAVAAFYRESGRYDEAIAAMKEVSAKSAEYWGEFGYTYQLAGKRTEAADAYVHAAEADKSEIDLSAQCRPGLAECRQIERCQQIHRSRRMTSILTTTVCTRFVDSWPECKIAPTTP